MIETGKPIKVAYICHFSNDEVHSRLPLRLPLLFRIANLLRVAKVNVSVPEFAIWNTNTIKEMERFTNDVEFHVISPYPKLACPLYKYFDKGIYYYFFRNEDLYQELLFEHFPRLIKPQYKRNRKRIKSIISLINPDIVHIVGAENPYYSISALDVPSHIPLFVQLQTLMSDPIFEHNYPISHHSYMHRSLIEKEIIKRADYIGTSERTFISVINQFKPNAINLKTLLALAEPVDISVGPKKFDFVYFASDISKAVDLAIEAFILASQRHPRITLNIIGSYGASCKSIVDKRLAEVHLQSFVEFSGKLPSHEDVINQIRLSRFALLPLKVDLISGTIREAMANGLPVLTTITAGTPSLNNNCECVMLSDIGDHQSLANNMCKLLEDDTLANQMRKNGEEYVRDSDSNEKRIKTNILIYKSILDHFHKNTPIPNSLISV